MRTLVKVDSKSSDALMAVAPSASTGVVTVVVSARPAVVRPLPIASHFLPKSSSDLPAAVQADFAGGKQFVGLFDLHPRGRHGGFGPVQRGFRVDDRVVCLTDFFRVVGLLCGLEACSFAPCRASSYCVRLRRCNRAFR